MKFPSSIFNIAEPRGEIAGKRFVPLFIFIFLYQIKYKEVTERVINVRRSSGTRGQHLALELLSTGATPGGEMRIRTLATEPLDLLHYAVLGRGDLLYAKTIQVLV